MEIKENNYFPTSQTQSVQSFEERKGDSIANLQMEGIQIQKTIQQTQPQIKKPTIPAPSILRAGGVKKQRQITIKF